MLPVSLACSWQHFNCVLGFSFRLRLFHNTPCGDFLQLPMYVWTMPKCCNALFRLPVTYPPFGLSACKPMPISPCCLQLFDHWSSPCCHILPTMMVFFVHSNTSRKQNKQVESVFNPAFLFFFQTTVDQHVPLDDQMGEQQGASQEECC